MRYYSPEDCTKAGCIPIDESFFKDLVVYSLIVSDKNIPNNAGTMFRRRVLYHGGFWYVWNLKKDLDGDYHECFKLNEEPLDRTLYDKLKYLFQDIEKFTE